MITSELPTIDLTLPLESADAVKAPALVLLTGTIYTARDAAHRRIAELLRAGKEPSFKPNGTDPAAVNGLPFDLEGAAIYYCGPSPAKPGEVIGSCGPTSSSRMDGLTPLLLENGLKIMIGKGDRSPGVMSAIKSHGALYLKAIGGAAAYYKQFVKSCRVIAFPDLGCEAVYELYVEKMPLINL